jgi:regulator of protease activity HflC (stomatin/prohibitin superfamily)
MKPLWILLPVLLLVASRCGLIVTIQPNEVGVVVDPLTGSLSKPLMPGSHLISPFYAVVLYDTRSDSLTVCCTGRDAYNAVDVRFADGHEATFDASMVYAVNPSLVNTVHMHWRDRYRDEFLLPTMQAVIREVAARYTAEAMVASRPRHIDFERDVQEILSQRLSEEGFVLVDFLIRDMSFSEESYLTLEPLVLTLEPFYIATQNAMLAEITPLPQP